MSKKIWFPGFEPEGEKKSPVPAPRQEPTPAPAANPITDLPETIQKAIGIINSGMAFVMVGIQPTGGGSGADFFTVVHGDQEALRGAQQELQAVIDRAYARAGIL